MTGRHHTGPDDVPVLLAEAVRFVATLDGVTVKDVREGLGCARVEADQALSDLFALGLVGKAARGRRRPVLFVFRTPPAEQSASQGDDSVDWDATFPDSAADDPGATQSGDRTSQWQDDNEEAARDDVYAQPGGAPASPFSDPVVPPDPFTDSDGNQWPTRDPFGPVDF